MLFCLLKWDHPRIRGKHSTINPSTNLRLGSPPHTREAPSFPSLSCSGSRITPAYAGSTASVGFGTCVCKDHPRIRGKHLDAGHGGRIERGSPPHTREAHTNAKSLSQLAGITPAYAGSTGNIPDIRRVCQDHPRIRGKHR